MLLLPRRLGKEILGGVLLVILCSWTYGVKLAASRRFASPDADEPAILNAHASSLLEDAMHFASVPSDSMTRKSSSSLVGLHRFEVADHFELTPIAPSVVGGLDNFSRSMAPRSNAEESLLWRDITIGLVSFERMAKLAGNSSAFQVALNTHRLGYSSAAVDGDHHVLSLLQKGELRSVLSYGILEILAICFIVASCLYSTSNTAPCGGEEWWTEQIQETEGRVVSLQESSEKLTSDMTLLLEQARNCPGYSAHRMFEARRRKFIVFIKRLKANPEHALWASGEAALLAQLQIFIGIWLEFSEAFSFNRESAPLRSAYTIDLFRCSTVHGVCELVSQQLEEFEIAKCIETRLEEAQEALSGKIEMDGQKFVNKMRPKVNAATCSCRYTLLICCIFLGMCIVSIEIVLGNRCYAGSVFVSSVCLLFSLSQSASREELMCILEAERQLELHIDLVSCRYTHLKYTLDQLEGSLKMWEHLTHPCLSILGELHSLLLDDPPEQALTFLWGVNQKLRKLRHDLDVETVKNPNSLMWDVAKQIESQLRNCSKFIRESHDRKTPQLQQAAQSFQILLKLTAIVRVIAVRIIAGYNLVNVVGTSGSSLSMMKKLKGNVSDSYVRLRLGVTGWVKTSVCKQNSNPVWNSDVFMFVANSSDQQLQVEVMDDKSESQDGMYGKLVIVAEEAELLLQRGHVEALEAGRWHRRRTPLTSVQQQRGELEFEVFLACNFAQLDLLTKSM